ncbi:hypothetical protein [Paenibacillus sp. SYP-B3998]|uniref:hypothetical protein n=1 Tax=Paenibacillus sp. SYP-B3998 TaxID=2678564 RepID=UPI001F071638|nr:hypothetical protein [Paenibacillus sp. SYP-B3998]
MSGMKTVKDLNDEVRELAVLEALLRRVSLVHMPFVLKGSLLTRQFLANREIRYVDDIDFLYTGKIKDVEHAHETFTNWMIQVTELDLDDGIIFRSFRDNAFLKVNNGFFFMKLLNDAISPIYCLILVRAPMLF